MEEARKRGLRLPGEKDEPLWPEPYNELTPEAAYRWLTECWWTDNEADGLVELVPKEDFTWQFVRQWFDHFQSKKPLWVEKSRRMVVSWMARGLECWVMGLSRGAWVIIDQKHENSAEHLWRIHFSLNELYDRRPDLRLKRHEVRGSPIIKLVTHVVLPNGSVLSQSHQEAGSAQGKGRTGVTLEELSKYQYPSAFAAQAVILTSGKGESLGGWVCGICNASPNPDWHDVKRDGLDSSGKPKHAKAIEVLHDHPVSKGVAYKELANGQGYLVMHYSADPTKDEAWKKKLKASMSPREWDREYELNEDIHDGKPVFETYEDDKHCPKPFRTDRRIPPIQNFHNTFILGWDVGTTMRPAAALAQLTPLGQLQGLLEITSEGNEPISQFAPRVMQAVMQVIPASWPDIIHVGDGTMNNRMGNIGKSAGQVAKEAIGVSISPTSNHLGQRQSAVTWFLMEAVKTPDGGSAPRMVIDGGAMPMLREGFNGAYKFEPQTLSDGSTTYKDTPMKNKWSDVHDAWQYVCIKARALCKAKNL